MFEDCNSINEIRLRVRDGPFDDDPCADDGNENRTQSYVDPAWTDRDLEDLTTQDWLLVSELLAKAARLSHLVGLVGAAAGRARSLARWALTNVDGSGVPSRDVDVDWRLKEAPRSDEYWFFTYPSNFSSDMPIEEEIRRTKHRLSRPIYLNTVPPTTLKSGPFEQDYLFIGRILLEHFAHPIPLSAYCSPVWRVLELAAVFADAGGAPAGDLHDATDSEWYRRMHPDRAPWDRLVE